LLVGSATQVRDRVFEDALVYTVGPMITSVAVIVLGLVIVSLWLRRRDPTYALFGFAAILWGVHTILTLLPFTLLPQPHHEIWWNTIYMTFVAMLCLFCVRFAELEWMGYRRSSSVALALPVPLWCEWLGAGVAANA
jgi:hypothetical protein